MIKVFKSKDTGLFYVETVSEGSPEDFTYVRNEDLFSIDRINTKVVEVNNAKYDLFIGLDDNNNLIEFNNADDFEKYLKEQLKLDINSNLNPFISSISGILKNNFNSKINIIGQRFNPDTKIIIDDNVVINDTVTTPNEIVIDAFCNKNGIYQIELFNGTYGSRVWGDNFIECLNLPSGLEQRFTTNFSSRSQFSNSFPVSNLFNNNNNDNHYSTSGGQGHWVQIDHLQPTLITRVGLVWQTNRGSQPFGFETSEDGVTFTEVAELDLPSNGQEINVEGLGIVARYTRLVWKDDIDFANGREYFIRGRQ